ncbi:MAG: Arsenical pump membrane protein [Chlamydiales bacterium]|nr:Arsenical pump membrane protein [Chlamydiales bacterium]MCH9619113.1 Arsenical pump membrane protein [Chlamydiales bacterium]MCH9622375.1 Arsenical pump membrane protein [Chlamydiales bacterium]
MNLIPIFIFVATLLFVIWRPKRLGIGYCACAGALAVYLFGFVDNSDVLEVIKLTWNATFAFVALIVICFILEEIGLFEWAALKMIALSKNSYQRLFINLVLLGAFVSIFFANDGAALMLTPFIIAKIRLLKIPDTKILPFVMAGGFIADSASLPLVTSNLVNIIAADYFKLSYGTYAKYMIVPFIVSVVVSLLVLYMYYRKTLKSLPTTVWEIPSNNPIKDKLLAIISGVIIFSMFVGCFVGGYYRVPVSLILIPTATLLALLTFAKKITTFKKTYYATPFSIIFFALGMFLVVLSLKSAGLIQALTSIFHFFFSFGNLLGTLLTGLLASVLACFVNNLPAVMVNSLAISHLDVSAFQEKLLALANIIGCDIGPKMFPMGSLATLLWLHLLDKQNIHIGYSYFIRVGIILTLPTVILTLLSLYLWSMVV